MGVDGRVTRRGRRRAIERAPVQEEADLGGLALLARTAAKRPRQATADGVLALQRTAGNQAVARWVRGDAAPAAAGRRSGLGEVVRGVPSNPPAMRPALDRAAEAEADQVADAAIARMGPAPAPAAAPDRLPPALAEALRPDLGDVSGIRVHAGADAGARAGAIGARAYAVPGEVHVDPAELGGAGAERLLAHEAVHAVRHRDATTAEGTRLVHATLQGTRAALVAMGGAQSTGRLRRIFKTDWDKILVAVEAYEKIESTLYDAGGQVSVAALGKAKKRMLTLLAQIERACRAWQKSHGHAKAEAQREEFHERAIADASAFRDDDDAPQEPSDPRSEAGKRQAIAMLLPRVRTEAADLRAGTWATRFNVSDKRRTGGQDDAVGGQMNRLDEVIYGGARHVEGYFKADKGLAPDIQGQELEVGIHQLDPNYGARAVAMSRLDSLLGTDVIARTEFAVHNDKLGTFMQRAVGTRGTDLDIAMSDQTRTGNQVSLEDPVLQRCLNRLQVIDVIAGQLDRHAGNWIVQHQAGRVIGVKGIDLDMAFGEKMQTGDPQDAPGAFNYKGMPAQVDRVLAQRILQLTPQDIHGILDGLLTPGEVNATVSRFQWVQQQLQQLQAAGMLVDRWDAATAAASRPAQPSGFASHSKTYSADLAIAQHGSVQDDVRKALREALAGTARPPFDAGRLRNLARYSKSEQDALLDIIAKTVREQVFQAHWSGRLPAHQAVLVALGLANLLLHPTRLQRFAATLQQQDRRRAEAEIDTTVTRALQRVLG